MSLGAASATLSFAWPALSSAFVRCIGTKGNTKAWSNPATDGEVAVRWSSISAGKEAYFVSRPPEELGRSRTANRRNAFMDVDLGAQRRLGPTNYALRNDRSWRYALRNWELQGADSLEGPWHTLRHHDNDGALATRDYAEASWPVEGPFRCFRVLQHGANARGSGGSWCNHLACAGIELYGTLAQA